MTVTISSAELSAEIAPLGAELQALRDGDGRDLLWNGDPTYWKGRAPLLFPIVGRLPGDTLRHDGKSYPMKQHGVARLSTFTLLEHIPTGCTWGLEASDDSLTHYPFEFALRVRYALDGATLTIEAEVENRGEVAMPVSFGFHPAFVWPLPGAVDKGGHELVFEAEEPAPVRRLVDGLLRRQPETSPVIGRRIALHESLFAADALVFDDLRSRAVTYAGPSGHGLRIGFPGMPHLGLWSKPGAGFLCIEPWQGYATPEGYTGRFAEKPGLVHLASGAAGRFEMSVALLSKPSG